MLYLVVLLILISISISLLFIKIRVTLECTINNGNANTLVSFFALGGLVKLKYKIDKFVVTKTLKPMNKYKNPKQIVHAGWPWSNCGWFHSS